VNHRQSGDCHLQKSFPFGRLEPQHNRHGDVNNSPCRI
jgi:hypothetical protein